MSNQSQILKIKAILKSNSGFLLIEVLVSLFFCFIFILIMLKFEGEILSLYERFFVRNAALDLAVNTIDGKGKQGKMVFFGRDLKLIENLNQNFVDDTHKSTFHSKVVVSWQNRVGQNEKLTLGSA